ncbi:agamous-like MADS-box protein MADS9 [Ricinus communis]|uniref:Mads box protein, putative n=1 Tax=Ricinus communis TaxID=3988 RepID=B9S2T9_RICCO|nr:agamous-like MADS-box protein MADS9 [Ricinus communis]EEF42094.1 mads box protein, putative [Ricinus communis]|eukprot:XP_002520308.1 floral homeotic protein GLOBOSA [Ricinus communis]
MGRGRIEIKRIENSSNRQVTYSKRRNGIIKKAKEITVLCDAEVSLIIFASSGKMHEYCSPSTTLVDMLDKYHKLSGQRLWDAKHENLSNEIDRVKKENDNMQIELRHLNGEDISSLKYPELQALEDALETGLAGIRNKQMEYYKMMKRKDKSLADENQHLSFILHQLEMETKQTVREMENPYLVSSQHQLQMETKQNMREMENPYHQQRVRDYNSQVPFAFRVQPIQPNLQGRM